MRETVEAHLGQPVQVDILSAEASDTVRSELLQAADAVLAPAWQVRDDELPLLSRARIVQSVWAGVDRIPVERLLALHPDVVVASGSGPNAPQVAEHAVALYLACTRKVMMHDRAVHAGRWTQELPGDRVAGSRVAVVGAGAIGRRVARAFDALDADVTVVNRDGRDVDGHAGLTLDGLRARRDRFHGMVLSLPLAPATRGLVDADWLAGMRHDAVLVNVGRGKVIVEADLYAHLVAHPGFRAGLDVWWHYPKRDADAEPGFRQAFAFEGLDNVVATPHVAFHVPGTREEMFRHAAANVARALGGQRPHNVVEGEGREGTARRPERDG